MRALCVLLLVTGCDRLLGLQHLPDARTTSDVPPPMVDGQETADVPAAKNDGGTSDSVVSSVCAGYLPDGHGHAYRLVSGAATWNAAYVDCNNDPATGSLHGHLVVLDDDNERVSVQLYAGTAVWIGLRDKLMDDVYTPITSQDTNGYPPDPSNTGSPWAGGEPTGGTEDCVFEGSSGMLFDDSCTNSVLAYLCECDQFAAP